MWTDQQTVATVADLYLGFIVMVNKTCIGSIVQGKVVFTLFCWGGN